MQNKINSSLWSASLLLFLIWYPFYLIYKNFNIEQLSNLWESIVEYRYWIIFVIIVHILLVILEELPFKKSKFVKLFFLWRKPIITIIMFIYPFFPDFHQRFGWRIYGNNVTDFYAIFSPIFIMFIITSLLQTWDPVFLKEMKDTLSIKSDTNHKINSLIINSSKSIMITAYAFLFMLLVWWLCRIGKVNSEYKDIFAVYPLAFFCLSFGISLLLNTTLNNKPDIKKSTETNSKNTHKIKNNIKKDSPKNIKVSFK